MITENDKKTKSIKSIKSIKGLTLIELMVTLTIVGILMIFSYPALSNHIKESNADALKLYMLDMSNNFERIKRKNYTYNAILKNGKFNTDINSLYFPKDDGDTTFTLSVSNVSHKTYTITGTPTEKQGSDYGKIRLQYSNGTLSGLYDADNDDTWAETWY